MHSDSPTPQATVGARPRRAVTARAALRLRRLAASTTAGGMMLVGLPFAMEYVVRPGDTLSEIAARHHTTVDRLVESNGLDRSGDRILAGQSLHIPAAHGAPAGSGSGSRGSDARRMLRYTVRPGDTPSGLAVRFHAWTAEVVERNGSVLHVGERIEIPVVVAAATQARLAAAPTPQPSAGAGDPSRGTARQVITRIAVRNGVDPQLALAVSWQEAGWQMHHVSASGAVGAMQIMPSTGRWLSDVVGRRLRLHDLEDNATAGVLLLKILQDRAHVKGAVAGYYQGLDGVRRHGMNPDTKRYVANVLALRERFERGEYPD